MDLRLVIRDGAWVLEEKVEARPEPVAIRPVIPPLPQPMYLGPASEKTIKSVVAKVAETMGMTEGEITGRMGLQVYSRARQIAILLLKELFKVGRIKIGKALGKRDPQTIWYAWERAKVRVKTDVQFAAEYCRAREAVLKMLEAEDE